MANLIPEYTGDFASGRFSGHGVYDLEGVGKYTGQFANGKFHGYGTLVVKGGKYEGQWEDGILITGGFLFDDGLAHQKRKWEYCSEQDPRFQQEILEGVSVDGPFRLAFPGIAPPKHPGCYDLISGYYDPSKGVIIDYVSHDVVRTPDAEEVKWIVDHCRLMS